MKFKILFFLFLMVVFLSIALIPTIISTPLGQHLAFRLLSPYFLYLFTAQKLEVSWLGPQKLEQISMINAGGDIKLACDAMQIDETLFSIAFRGVFPHVITIDKLNVEFKDLEFSGVSPYFASMLGNKLHLQLQSYPEEQFTFQELVSSDALIPSQNPTTATLKMALLAPKKVNQLKEDQALLLKGLLSLNLPENKTYAIHCDLEIKGVIDKRLLIKMHLYNSEGFLSMQGSIFKGIFTLIAPLHAEVDFDSLAKQTQQKWPLTAISSTESPLKLTIFSEGFQFPLNFDLNNLKAELLKLDLGTITLNKQGPLQNLIGRLAIESEESLTIKCTPAYLSISDGIMHLKRVDFLLMQKYPLASWGFYNLFQDQLHLTIRAPAEALSRLYGLPTIKSKRMVTLPITGHIESPKIDISITQAVDRVAGSLWPTFRLKEEKIPPPPTPIPWADLLKSYSCCEFSHENGEVFEGPLKSSERNGLRR